MKCFWRELFLSLQFVGLLQGTAAYAEAQGILVPSRSSILAENNDGLSANEQAMFISGGNLPPQSRLSALAGQVAWTEHRSFFDQEWKELEEKRLSKMNSWASINLEPSINADANVWYFFSGPDFVTVNKLYPKAKNYILCGLEPVGKMPDFLSLTERELKSLSLNLRKTLEDSFQKSFFITKDMTSDLRQKQLNGVLPIMYFFIARLGMDISAVEDVSLRSPGGSNRQVAPVPGVKISLRSAVEQVEQNLYYFQIDLSDRYHESARAFYDFVSAFGQPNSLLKSASYLMHNKEFSIVRSFLLAQSASLLQDDSGIPVRYFYGWNKSYYGNYNSTISDFSWAYQPELKQLIQETGIASQPLPFKSGYGVAQNSNLMLAVKKK